jgi:hypothetical protein
MKFEMSAQERLQYATISHRLAIIERVNAFAQLRRQVRKVTRSILDHCDLTEDERNDFEDFLKNEKP